MAFKLRFALLLGSFSVLLILAYRQWLAGPSALAVMLSLTALLCAVFIWRHNRKQQHQTALVLKALANQDTSLTLRGQSTLQSLLAQVQQQLSNSRQQAEARAQYLQALLSQLDIAVLEFTDNNHLLQANPAAQRLLSPAQYQQLQLGRFNEGNLQLLAAVLKQTNTHYQGQLQWQQHGYQDRLALSIVCTRIQGQLRKLVTLQSIDQALLQQEVQAYQQLTRVLTHEIANSVTPMASLAQSCQQILPAADTVLNHSDHADLDEALSTINRRGQHLAGFIQSFKQLSQPVQPRLEHTDLVAIIHNCLALQRSAFARHGIQLHTSLPAQAMLWLDEALMEQVLINLLQNAMDAMTEVTQKQLTLSLQPDTQQHWQLDIADSGPGISAAVAQQIFIPFFTTKQTGSGIGLSLSRALLQVQDAQLNYVPGEEPGSCFRISFQQ
ncbi:nitrogen fixation/metabolism regulation signal transduction histidine kinase [Rheinheimera pacifica]|uniref:sensor histidine kinase n=1 Tax=Rheinheimera pacifica TaxID=173990 RepID=UPI0021697AA2|nr:sensor histidine kinase [Rheinheimera pacifica]MCS4309314.1 nitrogen fixation/metabolism regulation signal transduction histidine kinase [Rheinheimera pacifica]